MSRCDVIEIIAVHVMDGVCLTAENEICEITNFYDLNGDEVADPFLAAAVVARHPSGVWLAIDLRVFESATVH